MENPREKYMIIFISVLGWVLCSLSFYFEATGFLLLGFSPLMASFPIVIAFTKFAEWVDKGREQS